MPLVHVRVGFEVVLVLRPAAQALSRCPLQLAEDVEVDDDEPVDLALLPPFARGTENETLYVQNTVRACVACVLACK